MAGKVGRGEGVVKFLSYIVLVFLILFGVGLMTRSCKGAIPINPCNQDNVVMNAGPGAGANYDNRNTKCSSWTLSYYSFGYSAVSIQIESAPDNNGGPGTWSIVTVSPSSGTNPLTSTVSGSVTIQNFYFPWIRANLTTATGSGFVNFSIEGTNVISSKVSGGGGGSGTVTSVGTSLPLTGGPITTSGTIACGTCATTTNGGALSASSPVQISAAGLISLTSSSTIVNGQTCTLGGACTVTANPSGTSGGDLSGSYPNPTVANVDGVSYPASPSTNTVPVVTSSNKVTYEAVPNAALAHASTTVNGTACTLGSSCSPPAGSTFVGLVSMWGGTLAIATSTTDSVNAFGTEVKNTTANELLTQVSLGVACTASTLTILTASAQPGTGTLTVTLRQNGANPVNGLTITVPASGAAGVYQDLTHTVSLAATDKINYFMTNTSSASNTAAIQSVSFICF